MAGPSTLSDQDRARLDDIVRQMEANGEKPAYIQSVVDDFKQKYTAPASEPPHRRGAQGEAPGFLESLKQTVSDPGAALPVLRASATTPHLPQILTQLEQEHKSPGSGVVQLAAMAAPEAVPLLGLAGKIPLSGLANWMLRAGAAGGTAAGTEAAREQIVEGKIDPARVQSTGIGQGVLQGVGDTVSNAIEAAGPALKRGAVSIVNRIAKPTDALLKRVGPEWGRAKLDRALGLAEGVLEDKIPFAQRGADTLRDRIDANQQAAQDLVANSTARVSTDPLVQNLEVGAQSARRNLTTPVSTGSVQPWETKLAEAQSNPLITKVKRGIDPFTGQPTVVGRELLPTVPIQVSERLKAGEYRRLGDAAYGELKGPEIEASKALARGWREAGDVAEPGLAPINKQIGRDIDLRDYIEGASKRIGQHNVLDLLTTITAAGRHPSLAAATLAQRASIGGPLAQKMYGVGKFLPVENLGLANMYRAAMLLGMNDEQQTPPNQ
jgi:hypothetical protein